MLFAAIAATLLSIQSGTARTDSEATSPNLELAVDLTSLADPLDNVYHKDRGFTAPRVSPDRPGLQEKWMKGVYDDQLVLKQVSCLESGPATAG